MCSRLCSVQLKFKYMVYQRIFCISIFKNGSPVSYLAGPVSYQLPMSFLLKKCNKQTNQKLMFETFSERFKPIIIEKKPFITNSYFLP